MPTLDTCHTEIVNALKKVGWKTSAKPAYIDIEQFKPIFIDIWAWREVDSEIQRIYVEVKCFPNQTADEMYTALGQYSLYRAILDQAQIFDSLYLAIPRTIHSTMFDELILGICTRLGIKLLVVDIEYEEIASWIE